MKPFNIPIPMYNHTLKVVSSIEDWNKLCPEHPTTIEKSWGRCYVDLDNQTVLMGLFIPPSKVEFGGVLSHELGHVVINVFHNIGLNVNVETQEAFCYCVGYLFDKVTMKFKQSKKRGKKK